MEFGTAVPGDFYAGYVVDDSDLEYSGCSGEESSDDEQLAKESGSEYQTHKQSSHDEVSSEDDFEKEMASEVLSALKVMAAPPSKSVSGTTCVEEASSSSGVQEQPSSVVSPEYYDEVYFDSDSSEGGDEERRPGQEADAESSEGEATCRRLPKKVRKLTNDELFYDPDMDDDDERWIRRKRMAYHNVEVSRRLEKKRSAKKPPRDGQSKVSKSGEEAVAKGASLPKSDAVLNCPACMVALCLDCQRHEVYKNQYRAMFVLNCRVQRDEVLKQVPKQSKGSRKRWRKGRSGEAAEHSNDSEASYHPVRCSECNTEVAVIDTDEVFHFFNVLASFPN